MAWHDDDTPTTFRAIRRVLASPISVVLWGVALVGLTVVLIVREPPASTVEALSRPASGICIGVWLILYGVTGGDVEKHENSLLRKLAWACLTLGVLAYLLDMFAVLFL